jgi:hypothetical protein
MAFSLVTYTGNGSTTQYAVPFPYISASHVSVTVGGVPAAFTWVNSGLIQITATPPNGSAIMISRSSNPSAPLVTYVVPGLKEEDLNLANLQAIFMAQEAIDTASEITGSAANVAIADEGSSLTGAVDSINFVGAGVTAGASGGNVTVTIPGGAAGTPGSLWYYGAGAPSAGLGVNADFYLNTSTGGAYSKSSGTWTLVVVLKGATGDNGTNGTNGLNGAAWFNGSGAPSAGTGTSGDYYLNTANGDVYAKSGSLWGSPVGNIRGPAGTNGTNGQGVPAGGSTSQVLAKVDGTDFNTAWTTVSAGSITVISADETKTIKASGGDFTTIQAAFDYYRDKLILPNVLVKLQLDNGTWTLTDPVRPRCLSGDRIRLEALTDYSAYTLFGGTNVTSVSGSAPTETIRLKFTASPTNFAVGDYALVNLAASTSPTRGVLLAGCWPVTAVDTGNNTIDITYNFRGRASNGPAYSSTYSGTVKPVKTIVRPPNTTETPAFLLDGDRLGDIDGIVIAAQAAGTGAGVVVQSGGFLGAVGSAKGLGMYGLDNGIVLIGGSTLAGRSPTGTSGGGLYLSNCGSATTPTRFLRAAFSARQSRSDVSTDLFISGTNTGNGLHLTTSSDFSGCGANKLFVGGGGGIGILTEVGRVVIESSGAAAKLFVHANNSHGIYNNGGVLHMAYLDASHNNGYGFVGDKLGLTRRNNGTYTTNATSTFVETNGSTATTG